MAVQLSSKETFPEGQGSCALRITTKLAQHGPDTRTRVLCLAAQSCPILFDPMDLSLPGSSVRGDSLGKNTGLG